MTVWEVATGSVRGVAHIQTGLPNQDSVASVVSHGRSTAIAAISDGHGGARYVRSDIGSQLAVSIACRRIEHWLTGNATRGWSDQVGELVTEFTQRVLPEIVNEWRQAVLADVHDRPFTNDEQGRSGVDLASDVIIAYGATLLIAIATNDAVVLAQLGDGDIIVVRDSVVECPIADDPRLVGGATTSLCLDTALEDFRVVHLAACDTVDLVVLSTDGYSNSFVSERWEHEVGPDLLAQVRNLGFAESERRLPEWLAASSKASGDDTTMALLHRPTAVAPLTSVASTGSGRMLTTGAIALCLGLGVGWLWGNATTNEHALGVTATTTKNRGALGGAPVTRRTTIVAAPGIAVAFYAESPHPAPIRSNDTTSIMVTRLRIAATEWEVTVDGKLLTHEKGVTTPVATTVSVASLVATNSAVWAVTSDGSAIVKIDPASRTAATPIEVTAT